MRNRILKFGGSALAATDQIEAAAAEVARTLARGVTPVVVVSAMSGMTNRLLATARRLHPDPPGPELDRLLATGESQAAALLSIALHQRGLRARSLSGFEAGITTDRCFGRARILEVREGPLRASLASGEIPVVTGFQGGTVDGEITTLGRGGTDITAVALGVTLDADRVVFYRDVDGIHTADPKLLSASRRHDHLDYEAMIDLSEAGAPILHPQAIETARAHRIELEVRAIVGDQGFTSIGPEAMRDPAPVWTVSLSHPVSVLTMEGLPQDMSMLARLHTVLERTDLPLEGCYQASQASLSLSLLAPDLDGPPLQAQLEDFLREETGLRYSLERRRRRVTLVGKGASGRRVSKAVEQVGARLGPPLATFWGDHHRAFVVPENEGRSWLASLHQELILP